MFGYVSPQKSELRMREFSEYRAVYCSLCRSLRALGFGAKLFLNYDFVFAAMLFISLSGAAPALLSTGRAARSAQPASASAHAPSTIRRVIPCVFRRIFSPPRCCEMVAHDASASARCQGEGRVVPARS